MRYDFFQKLDALYGKLDQAVPKTRGNACGECYHCCTTAELSEHRVSALELDRLEDHVGPENISEFLRFLARVPNMVCPFYQDGCSVYEVRPFSCRVFGHFRREDTPLPEVCIFRGQEKIFGVSDHQSSLPQSAQLTQLSREYWAHRVRRPDSDEVVYQAAGLEPELATALELLKDGDIGQALERALTDTSADPFSLYCKTLVSESAGRHDLSQEWLLSALRQAPDSSDLWFHLATTLLALGRLEHAQTAFERSLLLYPAQVDGWGLMGLLHLSQNRYGEAEVCLDRALAQHPDHPVYGARLEQARLLASDAEG